MASVTQDATLLGLCDGELDSKKHRSSFLTNKVGGRPDWPPLSSGSSPRCGRCGSPSAHVVQIYCPLQASPHHRNLHLFACVRADCAGRSESWAVLRSHSLEAPRLSAPPQEAPLAATDWCDSADDWGMEGEEGGGAWAGGEEKELQTALPPVEISSHLQRLSLSEPRDAPLLRPFFISVLEEADVSEEADDLEHVRELLREYEEREGVAVGELEEGGGGEEKYEKARVKHGDVIFSRFMKTISACPQQILRYCRGGKPVFITEPPANMSQLVSPCSSCGGSRTFELQLMPAMVSLLRPDTSSSEMELEFGTVLVYTCSNSCWTPGSDAPLEEFCFVQSDPDQQLFK